jgi:hypothetical protein
MQAESRKATAKSAVAARARMLLTANLGWLEGFPLAPHAETEGSVRWMAVPAHAAAYELRIERRDLSRAAYTLNKLRGELAPALERLADDPEVWLGSVERRLALLKRAVHQGEPLPPDLFDEPSLSRAQRERAGRLAAGDSRLRPLLGALSWVHAGHPARVRVGVDLAAGWAAGCALLADRLEKLPALLVLLRLVEIAASHGERAQALISGLFDERFHDVDLAGGAELCTQILRGIGKRPKAPLPDELPTGHLGRQLAGWCAELVQESHRTQKLALRLLELATPRPLVEQWALWWHRARQLFREAQELVAHPYERQSRHLLRAHLEAHQKTAPPPLSGHNLLAALRQQTMAPAAGRAESLLRALALVPAAATAPGRSHLCIYWTFLGGDGVAPPAQVAAWLAGFERYLRRKPVPDAVLLRPWNEIVASPRQRYLETVEDELSEREWPRRDLLAAYDHLAAVAARHGGLEAGAAMKAVELFLLAGDSDLAARLFESVLAGGRLQSLEPASSSALALRLCRDCPERFAATLAALAEQKDHAELHPSEWPEPVIGPLSASELGAFVREAIITRQLAGLLSCGTKLVILDAAGIRPLPLPLLGDAGEPTPPGWVQRYPPALHPALVRLAAVLDGAESRVERWLADDFPDLERLEREIAAIELRLEAKEEDVAERRNALRTRLDNLRARRAQPAAPRAGRLERLRAKLDRAWGHAVLERWESALDARLPQALRELLGIDVVPAWLKDPRPLSLLAAASRLSGARRRLALRLFRLRCGPPPWDLRDAPQNRRFLESLPHLDWSPWLDGVGTREVKIAAGRLLYFALEDDPLEIFRMGAHFRTCLSPGSMNYFSVFTNAADINKRLLYARDAPGKTGKVVGRCLLALTAPGELLRFEAYCHEGGVDFSQACSDFADDLARRMGARRSASGEVPTLVASAWYDDGPHDLGRSYPALEEGSALRRRLAALHPGELLDELRRALKPASLNEATLPLLVELPEMRQRPELVVPLLRPLAECRSLPEGTLITAAHLAVQAGAADLVGRLFLQTITEYLRRNPRGLYWIDPRASELLLRFDPARLLALLRESREKSVRDWSEETDGDRLASAAAALDALHRPRQAQALWRRLATSGAVRADSLLRDRAQAALEGRGE